MKITRGKITITDVAGVDYIEVDTQYNVVNVKFTHSEYPLSYEHAKLVDLRDALTAAIDAMTEEKDPPVAESVGGSAIAANLVRVELQPVVAEVGDMFGKGDEEPSNVLTFRDCEGDIWRKGNEGAYFVSGESHTPWRWGNLAYTYGPLTVTEVSE